MERRSGSNGALTTGQAGIQWRLLVVHSGFSRRLVLSKSLSMSPAWRVSSPAPLTGSVLSVPASGVLSARAARRYRSGGGGRPSPASGAAGDPGGRRPGAVSSGRPPLLPLRLQVHPPRPGEERVSPPGAVTAVLREVAGLAGVELRRAFLAKVSGC